MSSQMSKKAVAKICATLLLEVLNKLSTEDKMDIMQVKSSMQYQHCRMMINDHVVRTNTCKAEMYDAKSM